MFMEEIAAFSKPERKKKNQKKKLGDCRVTSILFKTILTEAGAYFIFNFISFVNV